MLSGHVSVPDAKGAASPGCSVSTAMESALFAIKGSLPTSKKANMRTNGLAWSLVIAPTSISSLRAADDSNHSNKTGDTAVISEPAEHADDAAEPAMCSQDLDTHVFPEGWHDFLIGSPGGAGFGGTIGQLTTNNFSSAGSGGMTLHGVTLGTGLTW